MPEPMSDERLAELTPDQIRLRLHELTCTAHEDSCWRLLEFLNEVLPGLIAEVRRLRRALQLSEASRGVPVPCSLLGRVVGQVAEDTENIRRAARALGDSRRAADVGQD